MPELTVDASEVMSHLEDLLANVTSRLDRITIIAPKGRAILMPADEFNSLRDLAAVSLQAMEPMTSRPNIGAIFLEGERTVELLDSDTGGWQVVTSAGEYWVDMTKRTVSGEPSLDGTPILCKPGVPLHRLERCRVGMEFLWTVGGNFMPPGLAQTGRGERVKTITRMSNWLLS
ncbi:MULTISPECIES: hypothetical protein [unclassified Frondihabitans]|uniref:hypothetical protein n=1 Tax=unclassified Frondihabitans TaxID=2626248 RepID=UPI000F4FE0CF|nr:MULTISPECIES: hypothetical protein [unclassified Frondihabitans]